MEAPQGKITEEIDCLGEVRSVEKIKLSQNSEQVSHIQESESQPAKII